MNYYTVGSTIFLVLTAYFLLLKPSYLFLLLLIDTQNSHQATVVRVFSDIGPYQVVR